MEYDETAQTMLAMSEFAEGRSALAHRRAREAARGDRHVSVVTFLARDRAELDEKMRQTHARYLVRVSAPAEIPERRQMSLDEKAKDAKAMASAQRALQRA